MIVEPGNYTTEEFLEYIINNRKILKNKAGTKKWLKMYSFITDVDWKKLKIFSRQEQFGDVYQIEINNQKQYLIEPEKGWIVLFSIANDDVYHTQIEKIVRDTPGIMDFWVKPLEFEKFIDLFLNKTNSLIYRFSSRTPPRMWGSIHPDRDIIRPNKERRISYSGRDATEALYEIKEMYGTVPDTVYLETNKGIKMRIKNDGLFAIQRPTVETLGSYYNIISNISKEVLKLRDVGVSIKTDSFKSKIGKHYWENSITSQAGQINIKNDQMVSTDDFEAFARACKDSYEHYNTLYTESPFSVTSEIYDAHKNSIMHADITRNSIMVGYPTKGRFDTTLGYFKKVLEYVDPNAELVRA